MPDELAPAAPRPKRLARLKALLASFERERDEARSVSATLQQARAARAAGSARPEAWPHSFFEE